MESQDKKLGKESARTDESLPAERNRTDRELADKRSSIEEEADAVVQRARSHAGDVLEAARATEDQGSHAGVVARSEVATERARDAGERAAAKPLKGEELERALAQLGLLDRTATLGPWKSLIEGRDHESGSHFIKTAGDDIELSGGTLADQDLIAAARTALPRLLATIRDLLEARRLAEEPPPASRRAGERRRGDRRR